MNPKIFKIKRAFVIPFTITVLLLLCLLILSLFEGQLCERVVLIVFFIITSMTCLEAVNREIIVTENGFKIKKFFRFKEFSWNDITYVAVVNVGKKVYFLLTTTKGFHFFSNLFENHTSLIHSIVDKLDMEKVEVQVRDYLEHPVERLSAIVMSWLIVAVIVVFIILKLLSM